MELHSSNPKTKKMIFFSKIFLVFFHFINSNCFISFNLITINILITFVGVTNGSHVIQAHYYFYFSMHVKQQL